VNFEIGKLKSTKK